MINHVPLGFCISVLPLREMRMLLPAMVSASSILEKRDACPLAAYDCGAMPAIAAMNVVSRGTLWPRSVKRKWEVRV